LALTLGLYYGLRNNNNGGLEKSVFSDLDTPEKIALLKSIRAPVHLMYYYTMGEPFDRYYFN
jgi:hypothetical protein